MSTGTGNGATPPAGFARINAWVGNALTDNTALAVYGGDLEGNLWRFQLDQSTTPSIPRYSVTKLATGYDPSGNPQPITVKPELAEIKGASVSHRAIFFGTGQFLGSSDKTDNQRQSIYAIKDAMAGGGGAHGFDHQRGQFRHQQRLVHRPARRRRGDGSGRARERRSGHPARHADHRLERSEQRDLRRGRLRLGELPRRQDGRHGAHRREQYSGEREDRRVADRRHQRGQDRGPDQAHRHHRRQPAADAGDPDDAGRRRGPPRDLA